MDVNKIKELLKTNPMLEALVGIYFDIIGEFSEEKLMDLYVQGVKLGSDNIEEAIIMGIKSNKETYEVIKDVIDNQKTVEGEIPSVQEVNNYIDNNLAKSKDHDNLVKRLTQGLKDIKKK